MNLRAHGREARPRWHRVTWQTGRTSRSVTGEDIPILTGAEIRQLPERHALVVAEHGKPIVAKLARCIDGRAGRRLLATKPTPGRAWPPRSTTRFTSMRVPPLPCSNTSRRALATYEPGGAP